MLATRVMELHGSALGSLIITSTPPTGPTATRPTAEVQEKYRSSAFNTSAHDIGGLALVVNLMDPAGRAGAWCKAGLANAPGSNGLHGPETQGCVASKRGTHLTSRNAHSGLNCRTGCPVGACNYVISALIVPDNISGGSFRNASTSQKQYSVVQDANDSGQLFADLPSIVNPVLIIFGEQSVLTPAVNGVLALWWHDTWMLHLHICPARAAAVVESVTGIGWE